MKNLPNIITVTRILFIPLFIALLVYGHDYYALGVLAAAGFSDALDGFIARTWGFKTKLGAYLDPIADKLLFFSSFITLAVLNMIPKWVTIVVVGRDVLLGITGLILLNFIDLHSYQIRPSILGKMTTVLQVLTIFVVLIGLKGSLLGTVLWVTAVVTAASGFHYIYREIRNLRT